MLIWLLNLIGDSGGPLLIPFTPKQQVDKGQAKLDTIVGITSFGDTADCGKSLRPGTYTGVADFVSWIESKIDNTCSCTTPTPSKVLHSCRTVVQS